MLALKCSGSILIWISKRSFFDPLSDHFSNFVKRFCFCGRNWFHRCVEQVLKLIWSVIVNNGGVADVIVVKTIVVVVGVERVVSAVVLVLTGFVVDGFAARSGNTIHKLLQSFLFGIWERVLQGKKIRPGGLDLSRHGLDRDFWSRQFKKWHLDRLKVSTVQKTTSRQVSIWNMP